MLEYKEYTDNNGYTYSYIDIEDLCFQMVCQDCHLAGSCERENTFDCCYEYNEKLQELEKKGIK